MTCELFQIAAAFSRRPLDLITTLGNAMLADPEAGARRASASLNPEGIPIELAVTASDDRLKFRLVVDPAATDANPAQRYRRGRAALREAVVLNGTELLHATFARQLDAMLPDDGARLAAYRSGPFCMAASVDEPGIATYIDASTHAEDAFQRACSWLEECLPDARDALAAVHTMRPIAQLSAVGIEGSTPRRALAKLYWRLTSPVTLSSLGIEAFASADFACFLRLALRERRVPASGLMLAAGFSMNDGSLHDAKINLCGHCLDWGHKNWPGVVDDCTQVFGLAAIPTREALSRPQIDVSFLTFGCDRYGNRRINSYFRPTEKQ